MQKVVVVGAGTMGSQIALQTARSGKYDVTLVDSAQAQLDKATAQNEKLVARWVEKGSIDRGAGDAILGRIKSSTDLDSAVKDAWLVCEAVFEDFDAKKEVFTRIGQNAAADTIITSNSSTIAISRLADFSGRPEKCCNTHFFHPVTVLQLCEVVKGPKTSDDTIATAVEWVKNIDRVPVIMQKEIWGFIVNRILFAASEEAIRLLEGGYASAEDIDVADKKGLNWPMGAFELLDFSGLDIFYGALTDRQKQGQGDGPPKILKDLVESGKLGRKTGEGFHKYPPK